MDINIPVTVVNITMKPDAISDISKEYKTVTFNNRTAHTPKPVL